MTAGAVVAVAILLSGLLCPVAIGAYSFGWWYRGRYEHKEKERVAPDGNSPAGSTD